MRILFMLLLCSTITSLYAQRFETVVQKGHELAVLALATSADSNYVVTTSRDKSAKLWDLRNQREVRTFLGHEASVTSCALSMDGSLLLTGSNDKTVAIWEVGNGRRIFSKLTSNYITSVKMDPAGKYFAFAGHADTAYICRLDTYEVLARIPVSPDRGMGSGVLIDISPDGKWIAFGEDNRRALLYSTSDWQLKRTFEFEEGFCGGCGTHPLFSPDSRSVYVAQRNGPFRKYSLENTDANVTFAENVEDVQGIAASADGRKVALSSEKSVNVYDAVTGKILHSLQAEEKGSFRQVAFFTNSSTLTIASDDNTAIVWDFLTGRKAKPLTGFLNERDEGGLNYDANFYWQSHIAKYVRLKNDLLISRDGKSLVKGKFGSKVRQWDIATGKVVMDYVGHETAALCYTLTRDGKTMVTGGGDGKIIVWDVATGDTIRTIESYREPIFDIEFSSDESRVLTSSWDGTMKIHELKNGKREHYFSLENASAYNVLFHPNDLYVFTARLDNSLQLWEIDTKTVVRNFIGHSNVVSAINVSKDARTLVTGSWDGSIRIWDVYSGLMQKKITHGSSPVHCVILGGNEKTIYSGGADRIIKVWDFSGNLLTSFSGHQAEITSLILSTDNEMLISHSLDGVTKFWDLSSGKEFFEHIHLGEREWLVKNNDGYFSGTSGAREYVHFVEGIKTFSVDQFFEEFYRPDLLPRIFQNRGDIDSKGVQGKLRTAPPPEVKIALVPLDDKRTEVYVKMTNTGSGVKKLRLLHNGKTLQVDPGRITYPSTKNASTTYQHEVELIKGTNTFTAIALNGENVESDPRSAEVFTDAGVNQSVCHILAIGINEYRNAKLNLNYAKPDALSFSEMMDKHSGALFNDIKIHALYDGDATRPKILAEMEKLSAEIKPEDVFVFYYAGHGSMVEGNFYFIPTENLRLYDQGVLKKDAIEASILQEKLKKIKALKQLIVMDACQSGGSVELLATRGADEEKAIAQLSRSAGIHVLASAGSEQFAAEFSELGHGLFTYVLLKALQGEADGSPRDGKVTIYELKSYIDDQVPEMTRKLKGKPQYPYTFSRGQDFPVVIKR